MNVNLRRPPPRKIITNVSVNDEVQLKKAENAWKPGMKRDGPADDPETLRTQVSHLPPPRGARPCFRSSAEADGTAAFCPLLQDTTEKLIKNVSNDDFAY